MYGMPVTQAGNGSGFCNTVCSFLKVDLTIRENENSKLFLDGWDTGSTGDPSAGSIGKETEM